MKNAGLPDGRFHDLRHNTAMLLLSKGAHPKVVQELLGHTEISMTMDIYSRVMPTMQEEAISRLNEVFKENEYGKEGDDEDNDGGAVVGIR